MNRGLTVINSVWWVRIGGDIRKVLIKDIVTKNIRKDIPYVHVFDYAHWEEKEHLLEHVEWLKRSEESE